MTLTVDGRRLAAVLAEPADGSGAQAPLTGVLLNAGAVRRIGPDRLWVEAARRWAARGVPTVRLDHEGLGEADDTALDFTQPPSFYDASLGAQLRGALDALAAGGLPARFLVGGLCSGAYWGVQLGLADRRVQGVAALNPEALVWHEELTVSQQARKLRKLRQPHIWRKILRGGYRPADGWAVLRAQVVTRTGRRGAAPAALDTIDALLDATRERGLPIDLLLSAGEPLLDDLQRGGQLARLGRWPNLRVHLLPGTVRTHTLRPLHLQRAAAAMLDGALDRALEAPATGAPAAA